jgi:electron transport complex protein RnfC
MQLIQYSKEAIARADEDFSEKESSNIKLGCSCGSE